MHMLRIAVRLERFEDIQPILSGIIVVGIPNKFSF